MRIALDAGHYLGTPGRRTLVNPKGITEWELNNKVVVAMTSELQKYKDVVIIRTDDATGKKDTALSSRTNKAKNGKADILVSVHHNAYKGELSFKGGTETWIYKGRKAEALGEALQKAMLDVLKLSDRGVKVGNMHMNREVPFPSALVEVGFMDSKNDEAITSRGTEVGVAMAKAIASLYNLKLKDEKPEPSPDHKPTGQKFEIGDEVYVSGQLYVNADMTQKGSIIKEVKTKVTRFVKGKKAPYNTTGDLGWVTEAQLRSAKPTPPTPKPNPKPNQKFEIGADVIINGQLYVDSGMKSKGNTVKDRRTKITRYAEDSKAPYNTTGDLGWVAESQIKLAGTTPPAPKKNRHGQAVVEGQRIQFSVLYSQDVGGARYSPNRLVYRETRGGVTVGYGFVKRITTGGYQVTGTKGGGVIGFVRPVNVY